MDKTLKHEEIKKYIIGDVDDSLQKKILSLKKDSTVFQILFDLIDHADKRALLLKGNISVDRKEFQFSAIDILVEEIILGSANASKNNQIVDKIYHSPEFYSRLVTKFNQVHQLLNGARVKEISEVTIKSDNEILDIIKNNIGTLSTKDELHLAKIDKGEQKFTNIWSLPVVRRFVYAAAAVLLIVPSIYFLNFQYNTRYKNHIAQNLLYKNYRIYMNDQPRLSGAYQSTGISQLMSVEEDSLNYLNKAWELVDEVLSYKSDQKKALHLEAQILIMQKKYQAADSILTKALNQDFKSSQMLNDLGVVYFEKKEWQKAKTFFKLSVKQDPNFPEAYYNLTLTELNLGHIDQARDAVNSFLRIENDPGWKNAGLNLLAAMEGE